jgi:polyphosphate kinase
MDSSTKTSYVSGGRLAATVMPAVVQPPVVASINRELSLLEFNRRVLALAEDASVRCSSACASCASSAATSTNSSRSAWPAVKEQLRAKVPPPGVTLPELRDVAIRMGDEARILVAHQYRVLNQQVLPALADAGVRLIRRTEFTRKEREWAARFFAQEIRPLLTPIGLDSAHPFPQVVNKSLNFVVELSGQDAFGRDSGIAIVKAPRGAAADHQDAGVGGG